MPGLDVSPPSASASASAEGTVSVISWQLELGSLFIKYVENQFFLRLNGGDNPNLRSSG
jgi:hypothetical protein